jgi:DNA-binding MarR family transcriptional regulator
VVKTWVNLARAQQLALTDIEMALKEADLPPLAWYDALLELERAGEVGLRPYELERQMLLAQYNLSRLIARLSRAGYVARRVCVDDGRGQILVTTASGRAMRRRMWAVYGPAMQAALGDRLSHTEIKRLAALLETLIERRSEVEQSSPLDSA